MFLQRGVFGIGNKASVNEHIQKLVEYRVTQNLSKDWEIIIHSKNIVPHKRTENKPSILGIVGIINCQNGTFGGCEAVK